MPEDEAAAPSRPVWSGTISFGLVSIPVMLVPASREGRVSLRMLSGDGTPLNRRYYCPKDGREVHPEHLLRGYQVAPDQYVVVRDEELEALAPEKSRDIDLRLFVDASEIDPVYFERAYYMLPDKESSKAYRLLAETMEKNGKAGIATFVMHEKEHLVAILADKGVLRAELMRFQDEVRTPEGVGLPEKCKIAEKELTRFEKAIQSAAGDFTPGDFVDDYKRRLLELVAKKEEAHRDVVESQPSGEAEGPSVRNLMAALQESLSKARESSEPKRSEEKRRHPGQPPRRAPARSRKRSGTGGSARKGKGRRRP